MNTRPKTIELKFKNPDWVLGQFLAYQRKRFGFRSQKAFAERLGIDRFRLANIEAGRTPLKIKTAWKACEVLEIHPQFLIAAGKGEPLPFSAIEEADRNRVETFINATPETDFISFWPAVRDFVFGGNYLLTNKVESLMFADVQPIMPRLVKRLARATAKHGMKAALAKWLGVHPQCVTDWLSGKQEPNGETTLRLLQWVKQQERQK